MLIKTSFLCLSWMLALSGFVLAQSAPSAKIKPETFFLAPGAYTCQGAGAIEDVERLDAQERGNGKLGYSEESNKLFDRAQCVIPATEPLPITVLYADDKFAFFCDLASGHDIHEHDKERLVFLCRTALIAEVRDASGHKVTSGQLSRASANTTLWDVARYNRIYGGPPTAQTEQLRPPSP